MRSFAKGLTVAALTLSSFSNAAADAPGMEGLKRFMHYLMTTTKPVLVNPDFPGRGRILVLSDSATITQTSNGLLDTTRIEYRLQMFVIYSHVELDGVTKNFMHPLSLQAYIKCSDGNDNTHQCLLTDEERVSYPYFSRLDGIADRIAEFDGESWSSMDLSPNDHKKQTLYSIIGNAIIDNR